METIFNNIHHIIQNQHGLAFLAVFAGGLISAASPCVLAAIPLIIGYVGGYSEGNKKKAALFSLVFVLGLSITFTLLGAAAGHGQFLGFMGRWRYRACSKAILMGQPCSNFTPCPSKTRAVKQRTDRGPPAWIVDGTVSSLATPVLAVILAYVSTQGDMVAWRITLCLCPRHCAYIHR
jgi:cytochrome c biogenesis protein CcdA